MSIWFTKQLGTVGTDGRPFHRGWLFWVIVAVAWLWVAIPFAYGLVELVAKIPALFG